MDAVRRQSGLAEMLGGNGLLAQVMGPNEDMADKISETEITVCEKCAQDKEFWVYQFGLSE